MSLTEEDLHRIEVLVDRLVEEKVARLYYERDLDLRERMARVEEELKHQRELMAQGFQLMDKRLEALRDEMDKRFEQVDKRFEQVDKRFEALTDRIDRFMRWSFATTVAVGGLVVAAIKYL